MDKRINNWCKRLLDTGKRNRLINFKKSLASTIEIVADDFYKLYDSFMEGGVFEFARLFDDIEEFIDLDKEEYEGRLANALGETVYYKERYSVDEINEIRKRFKPLKSKKYLYSTTIYGKMNSVLNNLNKKSKLYHEENGVNSLFLCFGFLKYVEDKQEFLAPLVLVPVEVYQTSITDNFKIKALDEDFVLNDNLIHKFKLDYKIDLSPTSPDMTMKQYLDYVNAKVLKLKFNVLNEVWLGLFSFSKIMMYQDIENNKDKIKSSEIVKAFCQLPSKLNDGIKIAKVNLDKAEAIADQNQVLAADSSQYKAIYYAKKGLSFVLQGPPGTGKSQTITNMLGELIAQGKTVLFVCEKRSALEVVYRNLKKCNLENYALPLFDTKLNKKEIVKGIYDNLESIQNNRLELTDEAKNTISLDEDEMLKLGAYAKEITKKIEPINKSLAEISSIICEYDLLPDMDFVIENPLEVTEAELDDYLNKIEIFANITSVLGPDPKSHPFYLFSKTNLNKGEAKRLKDIILIARSSLANFSLLLNEIRDKIRIEIQDFESIGIVLDFIKAAANPVEISPDYFKIKDLDLISSNLKRVEKLYKSVKSNKNDLMKKYRLSYLDLDVDSLVLSMEQEYNTKLKRAFKYKKTDKMLESYLLTPYDLKYEEAYSDLKKLKSIKDDMLEIAALDQKIKENFNEYYFGALTDFVSLNQLVDYLKNITNGLKYINLSSSLEDFLELMKNPLNQSYALMSVKKIENMLSEVNTNIGILNQYFDFDVLKENPLALNQRLNVMYMYFDKVYEYIDFIKAYQMLDKKIASFKKECLKKSIKASDFKGAFLKHFYEQVLEEYLSKNSKLDVYSKDYINHLLYDYQKNGDKLKEIAKVKIRSLVTESWPQLDSVMGSNYEVKSLLAEANKKRKLKTLRVFFKEIPKILMDLKPIFMTSPLTVATYLDSDAFHFDCVIFDEASQVTTENAIGAMYRSNQIIIVGDNEQLPPTSFFDSSYEDDEDDKDDYDVYESILDEALTVLPKIMLKWHYRSKDETLIAFSNEQIYHSLTTFPSFYKNETLGLQYNYAADPYTQGKRVNEREAIRVVNEVMSIAKNYPDKSLGVVTFNMAQQSYIERLIRKERMKNPIYEDFFSEDKLESFFVKNLETVQGDERDIIILSTTFGPDTNGRLSLNFGPINKEGGYRRLNVAISRAKEKVILCTSLKPSDFNLERTDNKGVIMLHDYISFASSVSNQIFKENDMKNGIVTSIDEYLNSKGYKTIKNIGYSEYKIDLAVLNPNNDKEIILGILTDQDNYQALKTIKDRNYTIDNVLTSRGWRLVHVFCLPFMKNKVAYLNEIERLLVNSDIIENDQVEDIDYSQVKEDSSDETVESLFSDYPDALDIVKKYEAFDGPITKRIDLILQEIAPIRIEDLKKLILPLYQKSRLSESLSNMMDDDINPLIKQRKYHKVIGFLLRPSDLYGVSFRKYVPNSFYPKIDGIYVEELEDCFVQIIKKIKTTSKKILYAEINELVGYPRGSVQTRIYFDRVIDILVDKGVISLSKEIIGYIEK